MAWYVCLILVLLALAVLTYQQIKRARLMMEHKDEALIEALMQPPFWHGQTKVQLIDFLGEPLDIDQKVLKIKVKEVWKYERAGKNRYRLKIKLEDGIVVGWDQA